MLHFDKFPNPSEWKLEDGTGEKRTCGSPKLSVSLGSDLHPKRNRKKGR